MVASPQFVFGQTYIQQAKSYPDLYLGRVVSQSKDLYQVVTADVEFMAEISGRFRFACQSKTDYPAVGDYVMLDRDSGEHGHAVIQHLLDRTSVFVRQSAGNTTEAQVVAANMDKVLICMALNRDYNVRRLERYLAIAWDSGAIPCVVLTKGDLLQQFQDQWQEIQRVAMGVDILVTSSLTEDGVDALASYLVPGQTVAFIGSSGVGKSTLINRLLGENTLLTQETRNDDKGRHTTSRRQLLVLPSGVMVIDTPGMRELGLDQANVGLAFAELEELAQNCRFSDCQHQQEPGCALRQAVVSGLIAEERLLSYLKLKKEAKYDGMNAKQIEKEKTETMFADFGGMKNAKNFIKSRYKNKGE